MNAKEIAEDAKVPISDEDYYYNFHPDIFNEFCKQLLKEQWEIYLKLAFPAVSTMEDEFGNIYLRQSDLDDVPIPEWE